MLNLVLVSAGTIVSRDFTMNDRELLGEIAGDTVMMRQVLVLDGDNVIYETLREDMKKRPTLAQIREILEAREVIRKLSAKEKIALSRIIYKAN